MHHYLLEITLGPLEFPKKQKISRTLSVPACTTFHQLHLGIWEAFMWDDFHLYEFIIHDFTEWTKKSRQRSHSRDTLLRIMEQPYDLGFGPPEKVSTTLTIGSVLADNRYKGKVIEYIWDGFSHVIETKAKFGGDKMVLVEASAWRPGNDWNPEIRPFTDEDRELAVRELSTIQCGGGEQQHESSDEASENDSDVSDSEAGSESESEASEDDSDLDEETENQVLDFMQTAVDVQKQLNEVEGFAEMVPHLRNMQRMVDDLREDLTVIRKRKLEMSAASTAHVAKKARTSYSACRRALEEAHSSRRAR